MVFPKSSLSGHGFLSFTMVFMTRQYLRLVLPKKLKTIGNRIGGLSQRKLGTRFGTSFKKGIHILRHTLSYIFGIRIYKRILYRYTHMLVSMLLPVWAFVCACCLRCVYPVSVVPGAPCEPQEPNSTNTIPRWCVSSTKGPRRGASALCISGLLEIPRGFK